MVVGGVRVKNPRIEKEEGLINLKVALYTLLKIGYTSEQILSNCTIILLEVERETVDKSQEIEEDQIAVYPTRRSLLWGDIRVDLTKTEMELFDLMLKNQEELVTHLNIAEELKKETLGIEDDPAEYSRPIVSRLLKKLSQFPGGESFIETVRGDGYQLIAGDKFVILE